MENHQDLPNSLDVESSLSSSGKEAQLAKKQKHCHLRIGQRTPKQVLRAYSENFTYSWFIWPMATLGLSVLISVLPYRFHGLKALGIIIYIFGLTQYASIIFSVIARFILHRGTFKRSLEKPSEALFLATFMLAFASTIIGAHQYGHPKEGSRLASALHAVFWIYASLAYVVGVLLNLFIFSGRHILARDMTPAWMLPIFPVILTGTVAGVLAKTLSPERAFPMLVCGLTFQGLGTLVSILVSAIYMFRLFQEGLPGPDSRPGMFLAVGPPAFTAAAFIKMGAAIPADYDYFQYHPGSLFVMQTMSVFLAIFFWLYAFWFCSIAIVACLSTARKMSFHLTWYSFVFPNAGFAIATLGIGNALESPGINWVGTAMCIILVIVWLMVMFFHFRAVWLGKCLVV